MTPHPLFRLAGRRLAVMLTLVLSLVLGGCAAQQAYREGQRKVAQGELRAALEDFDRATALEPGSAEYRLATTRTRERLLSQQLARAEQALERSQLELADRGFAEALALAPGHERALQGQRQVQRQRRWEGVLRQAEVAAGAKQWEQVRTLLRPLMLESPGLRQARQLMQQADDATASPSGPASERALAEAFRKPIAIEFRDAALKTIFEVLSRSSGLNFVLDRDVRADLKATIFLKNATVESALSMLLVSNQLEMRVLDEHSVLIYPNTAAKQREHQALAVRSFYLANAEAKAVAATLKQLLKVREAVVDEKLNLVIVRDTPQAIRLAAKVVALHDLPEAEVMLEVEVLEVKRTRLLDLGVRWPDSLTLSPLPAATGGTLTLADLRNLNAASTGAAVGGIGINARNIDTDANILANPRIRARNREKARIHIGERVPNITSTSTSTGFVSESITYVDVGLKLDVEPTIHLDGEVAIRVSLEVSNIISQVPTKSGSLAYQIGTRTASTVLRLKDGENQVLAGLISDEDRRSANKVPGLGEVPLLGRLFGSQADDESKTEIMLSITPRVVRSLERPDAAQQAFEAGTEASAGAALGGPAGTPPRPAGVRMPAAAPAASPVTELATATPAGTPAAATTVNSTAATTAAAPAVLDGGVAAEQLAPVRARWFGPASARVGETVSVQLYASSEQPLTALPAVLSVDTPALLVMAVNEGSFLRQGGAATSFSSQADTAGQVVVNASRAGSGGASAEAPLLGLSLKVQSRPASGQVQLRVLSLAPLGAQGRAYSAAATPPLLITVLP
jgi:general secretion pathway protein D